MKKSLLFLLLAALLARLGLAYFQYSGDVNNHLVWSQSFIGEGAAGFYSRHFPGYNDANYPPLAIYLFGLSVFLYQIILSFFQYLNNLIGAFPSALIPLWQSGNMQAAFLKLPAILADIGIGYLIYRLTKKKLLAAVYLFNPAVFYISAVWGQIESLPIFFPPQKKLNTDNAAMIALVAFYRFQKNKKINELELDIDPRLDL